MDGDLVVSEFGLDMIAFDDDVLSLCLDSAFADVEVQRDSTALFLLAEALSKLQACVNLFSAFTSPHCMSCILAFATQKTFGHIPRIHAKGALSRQVIQMMAAGRRQADAAAARPDEVSSDQSSAAASRGGVSSSEASASSSAAFTNPSGGLLHLTVHELEGDNGRSEIDVAVLLDRSVDLVSPMFTPVR